jgi:hypothetical protein
VGTSASIQFAETARLLAAVAREYGLQVPGFRSPPRLPGADRTIRWSPGGTCMVSVRVRGRPADAVVTDLIDGVIVANGLTGTAARGWREALRRMLGDDEARAA